MNAIVTALNPQTLRRFRFPILLVAMVAVLSATRGINVLAEVHPIAALVAGLATSAAAIAGYTWLARRVEGREDVAEFDRKAMWSGLRRGTLIGFLCFTATILIIGMFGGWGRITAGSIGAFLTIAGSMTSVAVNEEILFRGVIYRILEERTGSVIAIVTSSVLFGLTHLVNENSTISGSLAIALAGGTLTALSYVLTRSLWLPIGVHFAWNTTELGIFGTATSGTEGVPGLFHLTMDPTASTTLTGGTFGPEASVVAMLVCLVPAVWMFRKARRDGLLRKRPF
ncbi:MULTISPECIES: type II CAAX endopeptidase family protein [Actinoplanes]|uniref:CPBP family intramembrane glutamic endopeptidase n=1 Tax=Actinoplanes TaxID=1865 RepID=UPI000697B41E|nr:MULTISPECIES: type II CAAX endopeptidase family protein [Actinoplanes]GLY05078.1 hypothetical protein Acsp01_54570 [Actinoplanes sp. NBRC 101535]